MKTLIIPTHHNSTSLRNLNLKHYKQFPTGVHKAIQDFKTIKEAKAHLKERDTKHVDKIKLLTGWERETYKENGYLDF